MAKRKATKRPRPATGFAEMMQKMLLADFAPASALIDRKYEVLCFHGPTVHYLEFPPGESTKDLLAMVRQGLRTKIRAAVHRALRDNETVIDADARVKRDGSYVRCAITVKPITDPKEAEGLLLVTFEDRDVHRDTTQGKQAEKALQESESRIRAIVNTATDAIITIGEDGIISAANPATEKMFGYTIDKLLGKNVNLLMPAPYHDEHDGYIANYLKTGDSKVIGGGREVVGRRKDGTTFPIDVTVSTHHDNVQWLFTGIIRDITERKRAEEEVRREHEFSQRLTNTAQNIVLVLDPNGCIVRFNPYLEELSGWRLEEAKGRDWFDTFLPEHDRRRIRELFGNAIGGRRTRGNVNPILTKDGRERDIEWYDAPLTDADGQTVGLLCTGQDVTERRLLEREILEVAAEEQRRIGQDLHDSTQQQLTGLGLLAQNLAETLGRLCQADEALVGIDIIERLHHQASQVKTGLEHAAREVNRLSRGLIPVEVDAQGLMSSLTELAHRVSDTQQIECTFACDGPIEVANNFTATHLYRIAQEAVNNALRHSGAGRVKVSLMETNHAITLKVLDNGSGIDENDAGGPGMGLRIMAYRAELIGATLDIGPTESGGTEVSCSVPR